MRIKFLFAGILFLLSSCLKEEIAVPPHQQGDVITNQVELGTDYGNQIYFNLQSNSIVKTNQKTDWDIAFECNSDGWHIILNTSLGGAAANTNSTDFASVNSTNGAEWKWDLHDGNLDSTAIGDYRNTDFVYLIDRGYTPAGNPMGYKKAIFKQIDLQTYQIQVADLNGNNDTTVLIQKDDNINFKAFSFNSNSEVDIEPNKNDWDLLFTQYIHVFQNPTLPYLVTGVLLNRNKTSCAYNDTSSFDNILYDDISNYSFTSNLNAIGYDWKTYDFNSNAFTVLPEKNYIIKTANDTYFKLHFIDYYNSLGEKGAPLFELQSL